MVFGSDTAQISVINNLMDVLFVSRVLDMLSYNDESQSDTNEEWGDEVDVYLSEVCNVILHTLWCLPSCVVLMLLMLIKITISHSTWHL